MTTVIGWATQKIEARLRRGASGIVRVAMVVTKPDGSALDTYAGFTASMALCRETESAPVATLNPAVVPDVPGLRLIVDLDFNTALTTALTGSKLHGDLCITDPDGEKNYPIDLALIVDRNWTPLP